MIGVSLMLQLALACQAQAATAQEVPKATPLKSLVVLYDAIPNDGAARRADALGAEKYFIVYQGSDPNAARTGSIDADAVIRAIDAQTKSGAPIWGMLDFEDPFTKDLARGVDDPRCRAAVTTMVSALRSVRARFPNIRWTYYGAPSVPYWLEGKTWITASPAAKNDLLQRLFKVYAPIIAESDWVSCSIYPVYDPNMFDPANPDLVRAHGRAWRTAAVGLAMILANGKPVIPTVSPVWQPNGVAKAGTVVNRMQFLEDQIEPAAMAGAKGVALWTGVAHGIDLAVEGLEVHANQDENFGTRVWREAFVSAYLGGIPPANWSDPAVRVVLARAASESIVDAVKWIKTFEPKSGNP